jgi:hypothetical protein
MRFPVSISGWQWILLPGLVLSVYLFFFADASRLVRSLAAFGAIITIFGRDAKARCSIRGVFLTAPSPELAWRVLGVVLWLIAALVFVCE